MGSTQRGLADVFWRAAWHASPVGVRSYGQVKTFWLWVHRQSQSLAAQAVKSGCVEPRQAEMMLSMALPQPETAVELVVAADAVEVVDWAAARPAAARMRAAVYCILC